MAIGKITRGNGFNGVMGYLLEEAKNPKILGGCMVAEKAHEIAREFRQVANLRPTVQKPVRHLSISFAIEDGEVDDLVKEAIAYRVLDHLGYKDSQFIAIGHRRDQKEHDEVHNHDHMHIVTNAVTLQGKHVDGSFERYKIQEVLREVEREFGLKQIKSSWEVKNEKGMEIDRESEIAVLVANSLKDQASLETWLDKLAIDRIDVRFNLSDKGTVKGITFIKDGKAYKGSSIGTKWSRYKGTQKASNLDEGCLIVEEIIAIANRDVLLMEAANRKSQQHPVELDEVDWAMFDRAVEMAEMTLSHQGRNGKWKNGRAEIVLNGDNLKVRRVRPEKLMFEAAKVDNRWEPVGFPNIEKIDVQLLERINAVEGMDFKAIVLEKRASSERKMTKDRDKPNADPIDLEETKTYSEDEDTDITTVKKTVKERLQDAIDSAAEQATNKGEEYIDYLRQGGVKVQLMLKDDEEVEIVYQLDNTSFTDNQLIDASFSLLKSTRDLTFERDDLLVNIEFKTNLNNTINAVTEILTVEEKLSEETVIITTKVMENNDELIFAEEDYII